MVSPINGLNLFSQTPALQAIKTTRVAGGQTPAESSNVNCSQNPFGSNSEMFNGNSTGLNPNLKAGDIVYTAGLAGKEPGVCRILANA